MTTAKEFMNEYFSRMRGEKSWRFGSLENNVCEMNSRESKLEIVQRRAGEFARGCDEGEQRITAKVERSVELPDLLSSPEPLHGAVECTVSELRAEYVLKHGIFDCTIKSSGNFTKISAVEYNGYPISWVPPIHLGDDFSQTLDKLLALANVQPIEYCGEVRDFAGLYECFHKSKGLVQGVVDVTAIRKDSGKTYLTFSGVAGTKEIELPDNCFHQSIDSLLRNPEKLVGTKLFVQIDYIEGREEWTNYCTFASLPQELYEGKEK